MLHPSIIRRNIERLELKHGITLTEHSIDECIKVTNHFGSITFGEGRKRYYSRSSTLDPDGQKFALADWEREWIRNEMYMCACSFPYWFYRYFFIKTKEGRIQRPDILVAQQIYLEILADMDLRQLPILLLILKGRQLGMSTVSEAIILWIALFRRGSHCVIASAEEEKSEEMSQMVWIGLDNLPVWMMPRLVRDDAKKGPGFAHDSDILLQHGAQSKGISRGSTPVACHLSEVAYYPSPIETIESSLIRAMHENPRTFLVLETTARKKGDWFHKTWLQNRAGEDTGYNRFTCLFLPWYVGHDKYPTKDWLRNHPIPREWSPMRETVKQANDARLYVRTTAILKKYLGANWTMPVEQMWFWEFNFIEASASDEKMKSFLAELAADERSCFQSKKHSVYALDTIKRLEASSEAAKYTDYALIGDGVDKRFYLKDYWSPTARRIEIQWQTGQGEPMAWKLIPLRETPSSDKESFYIRIWQLPKPGYNYTVGVDISGGLGSDNTSFDVLRTNPNDKQEQDVQVAQLYSSWISSPEAPPFALALGIFYGRHMSPIPQALMAPEVQVATGDPISYQLDKLGYVNFYYMKRFDLKQRPGGNRHRRGWASLGWSRQMMRETLKHAIDSDWIQVNSAITANEMANEEGEETESGRTKYEHASDSHDDTITSLGICYMTSHDEDTIMERIQGKVRPKKRKPEDEDEGGRRKFEQVNGEAAEIMLQRHFRADDEAGMQELGYGEEILNDADVW
jgi:hypothetical protein